MIERVYHGLFRDPETGKKSKLYGRWEGMKSRCDCVGSERYSGYGGRGIKVCKEWAEDFEVFYNWAMSSGYKKELTLDRIDVNGNYEPSNCRWATQKTQGNNRTNNKIITYNGISKTAAEWSDELGFGYHVLKNRLKRGWPLSEAMTTPLNAPGHKRDSIDHTRLKVNLNGKVVAVRDLAKSMNICFNSLSKNIKLYGIDKALSFNYRRSSKYA